MMNWGEKSLLLTKKEFPIWGKESAMLPTPIQLSEDLIRVYTTFCDEKNVGRIGYFDINPDDPLSVINISTEPVLNIGEAGSFDDNGVAACSVVKVGQLLYMYYAGFEICKNIRYRILTGLAISSDGGNTFIRHSQTPILERSDDELYFRCGPFVKHINNKFHMWYVGGSSWATHNNQTLPVYDLRYIESDDGLQWPSKGRVVMHITDKDEHGFGRPYIVSETDLTAQYQLHYSIRKISHGAYRLGFATSADGLNWDRKDDELNLDVSTEGFDSKAIMFAAPLKLNNKQWLLYNGNGFGKDGVAIVPRTQES